MFTAHPIGIIAIVIIALLVFGGRGKISNIMGDMAKGITAFRKGLKDDTTEPELDPADDAVDVTPPKPKAKAKVSPKSKPKT